MFKFLKSKKSNQVNSNAEMTLLYTNLPAGERIRNVITDFLLEPLANDGFKMTKSDLSFRKSNNHFEFEIYFAKNHRNSKDSFVAFDISLTVSSKKYRKWELETYGYQISPDGPIDGNRIEYIEGWNKKYYDNWYDLFHQDNKQVMLTILDNLRNAGAKYFENFSNVNNAITFLERNPGKNLEVIIDLYLMNGQKEKAKNYFIKNRHSKELSILGEQKLKIYNLRKEILSEIS